MTLPERSSKDHGEERHSVPIGLVVGSGLAPEQLGSAARAAEDAGFDELWVSEDFFFNGGIASAAIALAATHHIPVGLGVVSALVRHPALLAMELATLSRAHPGRLMPGIGVGVPSWMDQMQLMPPSPLNAIRECVTIVRGLLNGEQMDLDGRTVYLRGARLTHGPREPVQITLGVIGPRMLRLSGGIADGSILSVLAGNEYIRFAREAIDAGREDAGRTSPHRITVIAIYSVDADANVAREAARDALAFYAAAGGINALTDAAGITDELSELLPGGPDAIRDAMPHDWVDRLTVSGTPVDVVRRLRELRRVGADGIALFPVPATRVDQLVATTASEVLPQL